MTHPTDARIDELRTEAETLINRIDGALEPTRAERIIDVALGTLVVIGFSRLMTFAAVTGGLAISWWAVYKIVSLLVSNSCPA